MNKEELKDIIQLEESENEPLNGDLITHELFNRCPRGINWEIKSTDSEDPGHNHTSDSVNLSYGCMNLKNPASFDVTLTNQNTDYELDGTTAWNSENLNGTTFTDPYLTVLKGGKYLVSWNLGASINAANQEIEFCVLVDQTTPQNQATTHVKLVVATDLVAISATGIVTLLANQKVSLCARNLTSAGKVLSINHGNLILIKIAS